MTEELLLAIISKMPVKTLPRFINFELVSVVKNQLMNSRLVSNTHSSKG